MWDLASSLSTPCPRDLWLVSVAPRYSAFTFSPCLQSTFLKWVTLHTPHSLLIHIMNYAKTVVSFLVHSHSSFWLQQCFWYLVLQVIRNWRRERPGNKASHLLTWMSRLLVSTVVKNCYYISEASFDRLYCYMLQPRLITWLKADQRTSVQRFNCLALALCVPYPPHFSGHQKFWSDILRALSM